MKENVQQNKNAMLKKTHSALKITAISLSALVAALGMGTGIYVLSSIKNNKNNNILPSIAQVQEFYREIGCNTAYADNSSRMFLFTNKPFRMSVPSKPVKVNINLGELNDEQKQMFIVGTQEINEIFDNINPAYEFQVNFNPTKEDLNDKNNLDIYYLSSELIEKAEQEEHLLGGQWYGINLKYDLVSKSLTSENSEVYLNPDIFTYSNQGLGVYQHEIMHHLGLGDAYKVADKVDCETVMDNKILEDSHISKNDVALLVGKYGDYSTPEKKQRLIDYIENYENSNRAWMYKYFEVKQEISDYFVQKGNNDSEISFDVQNTFTYNGSPIIDFLNIYNAKYIFSSISENKKNMVCYNFLVDEKLEYFKSRTKTQPMAVLNTVAGITFNAYTQEYYVKVGNSIYEMVKTKEGEWLESYLGRVISQNQYLDYTLRLHDIFENGTPKEADAIYDYISNDIKQNEKEAQ